MQQAQHVTLVIAGRRLVAANEANRRAMVRELGLTLGRNCLLFSIVDEHIHLALAGDRGTVEKLLVKLDRRFQRRFDSTLTVTGVVPVDGQYHLANLARYFVRQPAHHELRVHPASWSGTCLGDLLGARLVEGLELPNTEWMPRFDPGAVLSEVGIEAVALEPIRIDAICELGAFRVVHAAATAFAADPALTARDPVTNDARHAAATLGGEAGISSADIAAALGITPRAARRLAERPLSARHRRVVCLQLALERAIDDASRRVATNVLIERERERRHLRSTKAA